VFEKLNLHRSFYSSRCPNQRKEDRHSGLNKTLQHCPKPSKEIKFSTVGEERDESSRIERVCWKVEGRPRHGGQKDIVRFMHDQVTKWQQIRLEHWIGM
jgi:hypothetical protein